MCHLPPNPVVSAWNVFEGIAFVILANDLFGLYLGLNNSLLLDYCLSFLITFHSTFVVGKGDDGY